VSPVCSKIDRVLDDEGWGRMTAVARWQGILRLDMPRPFPVEDDWVSHAPLYTISEAALFLGQDYETFRTCVRGFGNSAQIVSLNGELERQRAMTAAEERTIVTP